MKKPASRATVESVDGAMLCIRVWKKRVLRLPIALCNNRRFLRQAFSSYVLYLSARIYSAAGYEARRGYMCRFAFACQLLRPLVLGVDAYVCLQFSQDFAFAYRSFKEAYL
jgi:hypothetical protein